MFQSGPNPSNREVGQLPPPGNQRWTAPLKAAVVQAVSSGLIAVGEACARYGLSIEEFHGWEQALELDGVLGLRATRPPVSREAKPKRRRTRPQLTLAAEEHANRLRRTIARFKRLLAQGVHLEEVELYRAEIAAAKAMLEEVERRGRTGMIHGNVSALASRQRSQ